MESIKDLDAATDNLFQIIDEVRDIIHSLPIEYRCKLVEKIHNAFDLNENIRNSFEKIPKDNAYDDIMMNLIAPSVATGMSNLLKRLIISEE